ncbi:MAG: ATP-binding protein [Gemmatimonadota bacterium]|nr:ATP-binding protein [Gemmatimonadota bacterium]MDH5758626.1 ATP-binding protein [Gemmatimonadota bacterium]
MIRIKWPLALATLFVLLLGSYLVYTQQIRSALQSDAETLTQIFAEVQAGITDPDPSRAENTLFRLQTIIRESGVPLVQTGQGDTVLAAVNLPFEVDLDTREGQARVRVYLRELDARNPPVGSPDLLHIHFGDTPELRRLEWVPWLQAGGLLLTVVVGFTMIRYQRGVESERAWTSMARELAHQLGTPLSSLQGWLEVLRLRPAERPGALKEGEIADAIEEDLERLERVSHRFELIGREPERVSVSLKAVVGDLERYLAARLPRLGRGVELTVDVPETLPPVEANKVLLIWALENIVKNALDALAGRGGRISIYARDVGGGWVSLRIRDTGPGVDPEIRDRIFEPGVSTKSGGWGVGLALSRRIVQGVHRGRIELLDGTEGTTFQIRLPIADD